MLPSKVNECLIHLKFSCESAKELLKHSNVLEQAAHCLSIRNSNPSRSGCTKYDAPTSPKAPALAISRSSDDDSGGLSNQCIH